MERRGAFLRKRDVILVVVVAITSYLSLVGGGLQFRWNRAVSVRQQLDTREFKSTLPIVTDLDGDGAKEVVMITKNFLVTNTEVPLHQMAIITSTAAGSAHEPLDLFTLNVQKGKIPVARQTGYVSPYSDTKEGQVIVVVREDWTVFVTIQRFV